MIGIHPTKKGFKINEGLCIGFEAEVKGSMEIKL